MSGYSALNSYGLLEYSSADSLSEQIYNQLSAGTGDMFASDGPAEAAIYARAMCIARAMADVCRAGNQTDPLSLSPEVLPLREREVGAIPSPYSTYEERRNYIAIKTNVSRGGAYENIIKQLQLSIGDSFLCYRPTKQSELTASPATPDETSGHWIDPRVLRSRKTFQTRNPISTTGTPVEVFCQAVEGNFDRDPFLVGEHVVVDPGDLSRCEVVLVESVGVDLITKTPKFTATFALPHNAGSLLTNQYFPVQSSTKRHSMIFVKSAAAQNASMRRKVDDVMRGVARGISTWTIVPGDADKQTGTAGPFKVGSGKLGLTPIGTVEYP